MALFSEHLDHHPSWTQDYKNLLITLQTHDLGGLSELDLQWAVEAERLYKGSGADVNV
jgi:4a-hydroxytetrahydrobiopterin dehydratase